MHAEEKELFERDGKKWVRFIITDPRNKKAVKSRIEAPLVRIARIKEPNAEPTTREVVRLSFQIGERKLRGEFTLTNRTNMLAPLLIGRSTLKDLGWVEFLPRIPPIRRSSVESSRHRSTHIHEIKGQADPVGVAAGTGRGGVGGHKSRALGVPFSRGEQGHDWQIEARVSFLATGKRQGTPLAAGTAVENLGGQVSGSLGYHY